MLIAKNQLVRHLAECVDQAKKIGKVTDGLEQELKDAANSYDALEAFSHKLTQLPTRSDWSYVEPDDFDGIRTAWGPDASTDVNIAIGVSERIEAAFLARVCGCMLGKPVEMNPTLAEMKQAGLASANWPMQDYVSTAFLDALPRRNDCWVDTAKENLQCAVPDDDISYTVLAMQLLEQYGKNFTRAQQRELWMTNLANGITWGPEHVFLIKSSLKSAEYDRDKKEEVDWQDWLHRLNPAAELCGAMIRADAYGYAAAGNPALAAELAYKDASLTHIRTGVYGTMYAAAAVALAAVEKDLFTVMEKALAYVPQNSRFGMITRDCLGIVGNSTDWEAAYTEMNKRYGQYTHCAIYLETGTLINSLKYTKNSGEAICMQVMQGNDTDSYGATAGSIAGMFYGQKGLDAKWLERLKNTVHVGLADFHEQDLNKLAQRMGQLPGNI